MSESEFPTKVSRIHPRDSPRSFTRYPLHLFTCTPPPLSTCLPTDLFSISKFSPSPARISATFQPQRSRVRNPRYVRMDHRFETELWNDRGSIPASYYLFSIGTYLHAAWAWIFYTESIGRVDAIPNPGCAFTIGRIVKSTRNDALEGEGWNERLQPFCFETSPILLIRSTDFSRAKRGMKRRWRRCAKCR